MPSEDTPGLQKRISSLSAWLMRHKLFVQVAFLLLLCLAGLQFYNLRMDTSLSSLFPDSSPQLASIGRLLEFNPGARALLVEFNASKPGHEQDLHALAANLRLSLANQLHVDDSVGPPKAQDLLNLLPIFFDAKLEKDIQTKIGSVAVQRRLHELRTGLYGPLTFMPANYWRSDPLSLLQDLRARLTPKQSTPFLTGDSISISPNGQSALLLLQPKTGLDNIYEAERFMTRLDSSLAELLPDDGSIKANAMGGLRFTAANARAIERDLKLTVSLSLLFIALIYFFTVRSPAALWLLLTPVAAVIFSGSLLSWIWPSTAGLALGFGAAVLGLAEDYAVLTHFALRKNMNRQSDTIGRLARPMLFSAGLCASAFCILMLSSIPALRQLGFFAAFSLVCGLAIALFVLPSLPWFAWPRLQKEKRLSAGKMACLQPRPLPTLLLAAACLGLCFFGFSRINFDASFNNLGVDSAALQKDLLDLRARWQSGNEPQVWASSGRTLNEALVAAASLSKNLREENTAVFSLADLLPPQETRKANITRWNTFITENAPGLHRNLEVGSQAAGFRPDIFAEFSTWFATSLPPEMSEDETALNLLRQAGLGDVLWWMLQKKNNAFHVLTFSEESALSLAFTENILKKQSLGTDVISGGEKWQGSVLLSSAAVSQGLNASFEQEKYLLPLAGIVCLCLFILCFRRPWLVLLACIPPLSGLASIISWLYLTGASLNLAGAAALILVIGLGANYGIVMLHELASDFGLGAFKSILVSGLTTLAGLGVLILAEHPALRALGGTTFFGLSAEMLAVLLAVPYLCKK